MQSGIFYNNIKYLYILRSGIMIGIDFPHCPECEKDSFLCVKVTPSLYSSL